MDLSAPRAISTTAALMTADVHGCTATADSTVCKLIDSSKPSAIWTSTVQTTADLHGRTATSHCTSRATIEVITVIKVPTSAVVHGSKEGSHRFTSEATDSSEPTAPSTVTAAPKTPDVYGPCMTTSDLIMTTGTSKPTASTAVPAALPGLGSSVPPEQILSKSIDSFES
eukprot:3939445-Rhodomonas_salina.1